MTCGGIFICTLLLPDSKDKKDSTNALKPAWWLRGERWTFLVVTDMTLGSQKVQLGH